MSESKSTIILVILSSCLVTLSRAQFSRCSWMESNIDYKGNDISYTYNAKTPQDCSNLCASMRICTGFTFWYMTTTYQVCFLKNFTTTPTRYPSINRVSCIMVPIVTTTTARPITTTTTTTLRPATTTTTLAPVTTTTSRPVTLTSTSTLAPVVTTTSRPVTQTGTTTLAPVVTTTTTTLRPATTTTTLAPVTTTSGTTTLAPVTTTALQKCSAEQDVFYGDQASQSDLFGANSVGECCDYCVNYAVPCLAYSYLDDQKICYVYYGVLPAKQSRANTLSGSKNPNYSTTTSAAVTTTTTTSGVTTTASTKCAYEPDSFFGFSDESDVYSAAGASECCEICAANSQRCILFSYLADQQVCYTYYGTIQDKVDRANTISGAFLG